MAAAANQLEARDLKLSYPLRSGGRLQVLDIAELGVTQGTTVGLTGPSGAGKTSLLYVLTGIEPPDGGQVRWGEVELTALPESGRDRWRRHQVGMIFQDFHLFEGLTPLQNVLLPLSFERRAPGAEARDRALALLAEVGVPEDRTDIALMSRGERQRIAIARALLHTPDILAVDEPTASLDAEASEAVIELLLGRCRAAGVTLLAVTHDAALIQRLDEVHRLVDGRLQAQAGRAA